MKFLITKIKCEDYLSVIRNEFWFKRFRNSFIFDCNKIVSYKYSVFQCLFIIQY